MSIKNKVSNTLASCFLLLLFFLAFSWIIFDFHGSSESLKDSWSIVSSIFGGIATLAAAYIASILYSDWKVPHNKTIESQHKKEILGVIRTLAPMEERYYRVITNYNSDYKISELDFPVHLIKGDSDAFFLQVNNLLSLLEELYFMTNDEVVKNIRQHYFEYAAYYPGILYGIDCYYKNNAEMDPYRFLQTSLEINYIDCNGEKRVSKTSYAYAFQGLRGTGLKRFISERIMIKQSSEETAIPTHD